MISLVGCKGPDFLSAGMTSLCRSAEEDTSPSMPLLPFHQNLLDDCPSSMERSTRCCPSSTRVSRHIPFPLQPDKLTQFSSIQLSVRSDRRINRRTQAHNLLPTLLPAGRSSQ